MAMMVATMMVVVVGFALVTALSAQACAHRGGCPRAEVIMMVLRRVHAYAVQNGRGAITVCRCERTTTRSLPACTVVAADAEAMMRWGDVSMYRV